VQVFGNVSHLEPSWCAAATAAVVVDGARGAQHEHRDAGEGLLRCRCGDTVSDSRRRATASQRTCTVPHYTNILTHIQGTCCGACQCAPPQVLLQGRPVGQRACTSCSSNEAGNPSANYSAALSNGRSKHGMDTAGCRPSLVHATGVVQWLGAGAAVGLGCGHGLRPCRRYTHGRSCKGVADWLAGWLAGWLSAVSASIAECWYCFGVCVCARAAVAVVVCVIVDSLTSSRCPGTCLFSSCVSYITMHGPEQRSVGMAPNNFVSA
jgi:hypothetical protein